MSKPFVELMLAVLFIGLLAQDAKRRSLPRIDSLVFIRLKSCHNQCHG